MITVKSNYCDNYFPPTVIVVSNDKYNNVYNKTDYRVPEDGYYDNAVVGLWRINYKKINPLYYCDGQRDLCGYP